MRYIKRHRDSLVNNKFTRITIEDLLPLHAGDSLFAQLMEQVQKLSTKEPGAEPQDEYLVCSPEEHALVTELLHPIVGDFQKDQGMGHSHPLTHSLFNEVVKMLGYHGSYFPWDDNVFGFAIF